MPQPSRPEPDAIIRTLASLKWIALVTAFTVGGAWFDAQAQVSRLRETKLDASAYYLDSAKREARDSAILASLRRLEATDAILTARISEMYCGDNPGRGGCR